MDVVKFLIGAAFFALTYMLRISAKVIFFTSIILLNLSLFIGAIFFSKGGGAIQQIGSLFLIIAISLLISLIFFKRDNYVLPTNSTFFILYLLYIVFSVFHNLLQFGFSTDFSSDLIKIINPWGLVVSFIFLFCFNSRSFINFVDTWQFRNILFFSTGIFFILMVLVKLNILAGNTAKVSENAGGIGLSNLSTNETALFAVSNMVYFFHYIRQHRGSLLSATGIGLNLLVLYLSQSRIGIVTFTATILIYVFININKRQVIGYIIGFVLLLVILSPLLRAFYEVLQHRSQTDLVGRVKYSTFANKLGTTLSGRIYIWEAFLDEFFKLTKNSFFVLLTGAGFGSLSRMFINSFLPLLPQSDFKGIKFYPLHSDLILIFITGGISGTVLWLLNFINALSITVKKYSFISSTFCVILFAFLLFDMMSYSPYLSLLIGLGISYSLYMQKK